MTDGLTTTILHAIVSAEMQFGPAHFVSAVKGGWLVRVGGYQLPKVCKTKTEAMRHAIDLVSVVDREIRRREGR